MSGGRVFVRVIIGLIYISGVYFRLRLLIIWEVLKYFDKWVLFFEIMI